MTRLMTPASRAPISVQPAQTMTSYAAALRCWPSLATVAADLGVPYYTVTAWHRRDSIPERYWTRLAGAAEARGLPPTYEGFRALAAARRPDEDPPAFHVPTSNPLRIEKNISGNRTSVQGAQADTLPNPAPPHALKAPAMPSEQAGSNTASNDSAADWMRQYRIQKRKCDEENGVLRNIVKRAKSDGMNTKAMIDAVKSTKIDPDEVRADLRDKIRYLGILHVVMTQAELFEGVDTEVNQQTAHEDDLWDAEDRGYRDGRHGAKPDSAPYAPGTEHHVHWLEGWHKGQASIARELGPDVTMASTKKARPRRAKQMPLIGDEDQAKPRRGRPFKNNGAAASHA